MSQIAEAQGGKLSYVKPHGALYNDMVLGETVLRAIVGALGQTTGKLALMAMKTATLFLAASWGLCIKIRTVL